MIHYINFYIDTKTHEIHQFTCTYLPAERNVFLGIYRNLEVALIHAKSKGFTSAFTCDSCNTLF